MDNTAKNNPQQLIIEHIRKQWPAPEAGHFIVEVGLSGGLDSVVLLHALKQLQLEHDTLELRAVHIHHGLSPNAEAWADFCQALCHTWHIPLRIERFQVASLPESTTLGIEGAARKVRYQAFTQSNADAIALAHHADDQIETFFLAACRGGGLRALSAMPPLRALNTQTTLWRPLLSFSRATLLAYAQSHQLEWIEDESNHNTQFLRNRLRHDLLPTWQKSIPHFQAHIEQSIASLQHTQALLAEYEAADSALCLDEHGRLNRTKWQSLSPKRAQQQLYLFAKKNQLGTPSAASVAAFAKILHHPHTQQAIWHLTQSRAILYACTLFAENKALQTLDTWFEKYANSQIYSHEIWQPHHHGLPETLIRPHAGRWRHPEPNERLSFAYGHKKVQKILQEYRIAPFLRPFWPVWANLENECLTLANIPHTSHTHSIANGYICHTQNLFCIMGN